MARRFCIVRKVNHKEEQEVKLYAQIRPQALAYAGVTFVVFFILNLAPGDPAAIILGDQATAEALAMKREELGLNDPIFIRYFHYMRDLLHGSLGVSYKNSIPVWDQVIMRLPNTAILATAGILVALLIGIPIGIISAKKQYSLLDNVCFFL